MFDAAVSAAHPATALPPALPDLAPGETVRVIGAGKAAAAMAAALETHYAAAGTLSQVSGHVTTRHGYRLTDAGREPVIAVYEAGHPVPDQASLDASARALAAVVDAPDDATIIVLLSGGASAIWTGLVPGVSLDAYQALTRDLLRSGATISEINTIRKHVSTISGGRLAAKANGRRMLTFAISDVPHDDASMIGSGPTVADPTTLDDAAMLLKTYDVAPAASIAVALASDANETLKADDPAFVNADYTLIAAPRMSLEAGAELASAAGYEVEMLGDALEGEARDVATAQAERARAYHAEGRKVALLSGGELTVTMRGNGRGGPNQEFALALAAALDGAPGICAIAGDTDGTDGGDGAADDPAGAIITPDTLAACTAADIDVKQALAENNSGGAFRAIDALLVTGPTQTNVNDFRAILIDPEVTS
ncbi:MAG: DUF4147 domain-containing protein [Pseudomonadota bacterium]